MIIGKMMEWIHVNMLFYSIAIFTAVMWLLRYYSLGLIDKQKQEMEEGEMGIELLDKRKDIL